MNKFLIGIVLFVFSLGSVAVGQTDKGSFDLLTFKQIEAETPWLFTGNAASLSLMPELFPAEVELGYQSTSGNFHSVFSGNNNQALCFRSRSYHKINKTNLYGSFSYNRSFDKNVNFSNTNNPAMNAPYLLVDTIGHDTYSREFFYLSGMISSPVTQKLTWGLSYDYQAGTAVQNRDPRPENKVLQTTISPGLLFQPGQFRLGGNLTYGYYNEDIDVLVVESGAVQTLFQMHGPGVFTYHSSSSFKRLYQQHQLGAGMQVGWNQRTISNILFSDYSYRVQTIDDGRAGSQATWAAVKNDARLHQTDWRLTDVLSVDQGKKNHQIKAALNLASKLGTEFIQRLEKTGNAVTEQWVNYANEQKYYSLQTKAELSYQLLAKDEKNLLKSLFKAGIYYSASDEKYYLPNQEMAWSNLMAKSSFLKSIALPEAALAAEVRLNYQFNLESRENLSVTNFSVQKIYAPEFDYLTENFVSPGLSFSYQIPLQKAFERYFIKTDFDWYHSASAKNQTIFKFSTGLIF